MDGSRPIRVLLRPWPRLNIFVFLEGWPFRFPGTVSWQFGILKSVQYRNYCWERGRLEAKRRFHLQAGLERTGFHAVLTYQSFQKILLEIFALKGTDAIQLLWKTYLSGTGPRKALTVVQFGFWIDQNSKLVILLRNNWYPKFRRSLLFERFSCINFNFHIVSQFVTLWNTDTNIWTSIELASLTQAVMYFLLILEHHLVTRRLRKIGGPFSLRKL